MLGKSDMNLFVKSKEECYFVNGLEVVSFHDIFTEIGVIYLLLLLLIFFLFFFFFFGSNNCKDERRGG